MICFSGFVTLKEKTMKLWSPSNDEIAQSNITAYQAFLKEHHQLEFENYDDLHRWSITHIGSFWSSIAEFFEVDLSSDFLPYKPGMPFYNTKWFEGSKLNYTKYLFKKASDQRAAICYQSEDGVLKELSWNQLKTAVSQLQKRLLSIGIKKGDTVAAYALNTPETIVAFLASNALGAIWSSCSPDFGVQSVVDRFKQIEPKLLFAHNSYQYHGKHYDLSEKVSDIKKELTSLKAVLELNEELCYVEDSFSELLFEELDFDHPIWVLYSSGTTGTPKAITHSCGGILLEHLKALALHQNLKEGERYFWYSTTGWMMWNYALSSLLCGATLCLYNGSATYPKVSSLWEFAQNATINHFGGGAAYFIHCMQKNALESIDLSTLKTIGSTGSPLSSQAFDWYFKQLPKVQMVSLSGGTDVCTAFVGGCPTKAVYSGEIQCASLGVDLKAFDETGTEVVDALGELIVAKPMPSMPIYFWNDHQYKRYKSSYFEKFEGVWCHGDYIRITPRNGIVIYGRSDATLNKNGVRIGTAEIYNSLDEMSELDDALIVNIEREDGSSFMPLFVALKSELNESIRSAIKKQLKEKCSPRHLPDEIIRVAQIPYTISGKKMEVPVKKILMGIPKQKAATVDAMKNPSSLDDFESYYLNSLS